MPAKKLDILLVEDHVATGEALKIMLERRGHRVGVAVTGQEALHLARKQPYDLLISDVGLPDIDGWTLLGRLRRQRPGLKAMAISGHSYASDFQRSDEAGFARHLAKPVQIRAVDETIAALFPNISEGDTKAAAPASENSGT